MSEQQLKMTVDEIANFENVQAKVAEEKRIELEASTSKAALLDRLGITEEEARLLIGAI